jgi:hypothetical protein
LQVSDLRMVLSDCKYRLTLAHVDPLTAENNLSFIETSALDASNVEQAFQNILTGELLCLLYIDR